MKYQLSWIVLFAIGICVLLEGCIIAPIPSPTRRVGPQGKIKELNLNAFAPGKTTYDEMSKELSAVDTGIKLPNAYWARWERSKWTWVMAVGGPGAAAGGGSRFWSADNFIAEFDDKGVMKEWRVVRDEALAAQLCRFVQAGKRWDGDERIEFDIVHDHRAGEGGGVLALHRDYVEFAERGKQAAKHSFKIEPKDIAGLATRNLEHQTDSVNIAIVGATLRFRTTTATGEQLKMLISPEHLVDLIAYLRERAPEAAIN
jgi:hypothetical protein